MIILIIIFWSSIVLLVHSYLLFPLIIQHLAKNKTANTIVYNKKEDLPYVSVVMSVYNEKDIIEDKITSLYKILYPQNKFEVIVGSDASNDGTQRICMMFGEKYRNFKFIHYEKRQGKPAVINELMKKARGDIVVLTDAKVIFTQNTIFELVKHFRNSRIDIVGGNILNKKTSRDGISVQEKAFMNREIIIKNNEGILWGQTIGIYGAVYAIRKSSFTRIPEGFSVDDFFVTMNVLKKNGRAIMNLEAVTLEDVPNLLSTEFRRKVRISAGNYQNLRYFLSCLWPPFSSLSFAFFSHKVIRWVGPFLILFTFVSNIFLVKINLFYQITFGFQVVLFILPLIDLFLRKINLRIVFLRFITHFFAMNAALFAGFLKILSGRKTNIWQPTRR